MASGLATRCPACDTAFRVVLDQLRVSDGWVRCGRCAEVFNAGERLIDVESGAPRKMPEPDPGELAPASSTAPARPAGGVDIEFESAPYADAAEAADAVPQAAASQPAAADSALWRSEPAPGPAAEPEPDAELRADPSAMPSFL
ncbi:MAG: zinc-ribbon domain-containing protein, partial [Burkholderiales bacterium]|nr:zinc-ribbon domain-containing protein [Burkholderiales bacterium]